MTEPNSGSGSTVGHEMRAYDYIEVDTIEDADLFLPGMRVLLGDTDEEWIVSSIDTQPDGFVITVYKD